MKQLFLFFIVLLSINNLFAQKIYVTNTEAWADLVVYAEETEAWADLIIYYTDTKAWAGWEKNQKKYLLE